MENSLNIRPLTIEKTGMKQGILDGEVAVITGGGSNIGLGTARSLAWLGAKVVIAQRTEQRGQAVEELINRENKPGTALFVRTDVTDEKSVKEMAKKAFNTFGKVDILLNNAMNMGVGGHSILGATPDILDQQCAISIRGTLHCIQAFVPATTTGPAWTSSRSPMPTTRFRAMMAGCATGLPQRDCRLIVSGPRRLNATQAPSISMRSHGAPGPPGTPIE